MSQLGAQSKWAQLPPTSSPSSLSYSTFHLVCVVNVSYGTFHPFIELFSSRISAWFFLMTSISLLNFSFSCVFLVTLSYLSVFSCSLLSFLKRVILSFLSTRSQNSISLNSVTEGLPFGDAMFPSFFMFLEVLHCCQLLKSVLVVFG